MYKTSFLHDIYLMKVSHQHYFQLKIGTNIFRKKNMCSKRSIKKKKIDYQCIDTKSV